MKWRIYKESVNMGQYHWIVNLDRKEFLDSHQLGCGLKLWEQLNSKPSPIHALFILLACSNGRGGGDLSQPEGNRSDVIGRWAGDRIAVIGDYAESDDLGNPHDPFVGDAKEIIEQCIGEKPTYKDISSLVIPFIESNMQVYYNEIGHLGSWEDVSI